MIPKHHTDGCFDPQELQHALPVAAVASNLFATVTAGTARANAHKDA